MSSIEEHVINSQLRKSHIQFLLKYVDDISTYFKHSFKNKLQPREKTIKRNFLDLKIYQNAINVTKSFQKTDD